VNAANTGDTIEIQDNSVYTEEIRYSDTPIIQSITIKAGTGYSPILDGNSEALDIGIECYIGWTVQGLEIRNFDEHAIEGMGNDRLFYVYDCVIHGISGHAIHRLKNGSAVERCKIYDITGSNNKAIEGSVQSITVRNCLVYNIADRGITATGGSTLVEHCTVDNCGTDGSATYSIYAFAGTIRFCTVYGNSNITVAGIRASSHSYNNVYNHTTNYYGGAGTGDLEADPLFTDRAGDDYTLSSASPCIAASVGSTVADDLENRSRRWDYDHKVIGFNTWKDEEMGSYERYEAKVLGVTTSSINKVMGQSG